MDGLLHTLHGVGGGEMATVQSASETVKTTAYFIDTFLVQQALCSFLHPVTHM